MGQLPAEKQLIYSIVNAFLNNITFHHPQAEELLVAALKDETCLTPSIHLHVEEVFSPIFFHYPKWLKRPVCVGAARYQPIHSPVAFIHVAFLS